MNAFNTIEWAASANGGSMADLNSYTLLQSGSFGEMIDGSSPHRGSLLLVGTAAYWASRYKKCPSNKILVVYGKVAVASLPRLCTVVVLSSGRSFNLTSSCRLSPYS